MANAWPTRDVCQTTSSVEQMSGCCCSVRPPGAAQAGTRTWKSSQEQATSSGDASGMVDSERQPATSAAAPTGSSSSTGRDDPGAFPAQDVERSNIVGSDAPSSSPQADVDGQVSSATMDTMLAKFNAMILAAVDAAVERKLADANAKILAMVDAAVERRMAMVEAKLL